MASVTKGTRQIPGSSNWGLEARRSAFQRAVSELNTRFSQAGLSLNYHNGFIQITTDDLIQVTCSPEFQPVISLVHLLEMDDETQSIH